MKNKFNLIIVFFLILILTNCKKNEIEKESTVATYYFEAIVDNEESKAIDMGMSSLSSEIRWITAENGTGCFANGSGIGIKIHKNYLKVGEYTLNSLSKDKYSGEFYTTDSYGEVDSIFSTINTNTNGVLAIDMIEDSPETEIMKVISGRFAFYAVEENSGNGKVITYGKFKILAHSAFFN